MGSMVERDPSAELKAENVRLIALLEANGIQWRVQQDTPSARAPAAAGSKPPHRRPRQPVARVGDFEVAITGEIWVAAGGLASAVDD